MQIDPQHSLQLAFQHLEAFSVPGVGTFTRKHFSADIDHSQKIITPPGEHFVLEKGEGLLANLEDFYFRYLDLKITRARELVQEVGKFVQEELKTAGHLLLPGWGELSGTDKIEFSHQDDLAAMPDAFFGLQPVGYTLGGLVASDKESREAAAAASVEANTVRVEPVPPPVRRRSKGRPWLILLLVLLLVGSGAAMIWQDQFMGVLDRIGLVNGNNGEGGDPIASNINITPVDTVMKPSPLTPGDTTVPNLEPDLVDPVSPPDTDTNTDADNSTSKIKPGEYAQAGNYYLIVAAVGSGEEAKRMVSKFRKGGARPKIIAPRGRGLYKISVHQSTDKMQVIDKMVQWKDTFPVKSWIYWPGM